MPQAILPMFSDDMTVINHHIAVQQKGETIYWYQGMLPAFRHHVKNEKLFRLFCCQFINLGVATSAEKNPHIKSQKDTDARWVQKNRVNYFGYKNHVKEDVGSKMLLKYLVTDASVYDSQATEELLEETDKGEIFYADSEHRGQVQLVNATFGG